MKNKPLSYTLSASNLKQAAITIHLNYLHRIQEQMIEEALAKSDYTEAKAVIKHIMEKK